MNRTTVFSLSLLCALNAGATDQSALQLAQRQPSLLTANALDDTLTDHKATTEPTETSVYIVQLKDPALARYKGGIANLAATSPLVTGAKALNVNSAPSQSYINYLEEQQDRFEYDSEELISRALQIKHRYQRAFNGVAMQMSAEEAEHIAKLPSVQKVTAEKYETLLTDVGPQWIGAPKIWHAQPPLRASKGEGVVVAILDTGINHDHPSFADVGGDGYDHDNPLGKGNYIPGSYCDVVDPSFCNDKLIGAWGMVRGETDPNSPEDSDGHGSHTAGTVAGNVIPQATLSAPTTSITRSLSGVAPHANIIAYDVCDSNCPSSAILAALEQVLKDASALPNGIQALNFSISGGADPYNDPTELAFLNAAAAGIFVSASAGNAGPGASTVAHNSPWVSTVAAMTHNRAYTNSLLDLTSDGSSLSDITSVGFTSGYGPAAIVHAADYPTSDGSSNDTDPGQCLEPFPAGHFSGQIVVCDRGKIARVAKGANVLAGGAGGFVLANLEAQGESVSGDAHVLPGVHIGFKDAQVLREWLATQSNPMATISGTAISEEAANGDVMAGFSSRGPALSMDILKPDIGAPGVAIMAAVETSSDSNAPEYGLLSGTSMSSPHNAGAAALISAARPDWSPFAIKSAMMMSAKTTGMFKEDGVTSVDPFDVGAGRVDLSHVQQVGLILDETPENFLAANPLTGGDPKTLNIASMKDSNCVGICSWTRTVTNATDDFSSWQLTTNTPAGVALSIEPSFIDLMPGEQAKITVTADTTLASEGWNFSQLKLSDQQGANLQMPIAILPSVSSDSALLKLSVNKAQATEDDVLDYEIRINNKLAEDVITLEDILPEDIEYVEGTATQTIVRGSTISPFEGDDDVMTWIGKLEPGQLTLEPSSAPFGYVPLSEFTEPYGCPRSSCDDGAVVLKVPSFVYAGETYTEVVWSVNGTLQAGAQSTKAARATGQQLPNPTPPNNIMAPLWSDLNMGSNGDGAEWYVATLSKDGQDYTVYEWNNIPQYDDPETRYTFQIWVQNGESGNIWFVYHQIDGKAPLANVSVGVEDQTGTLGHSYFYQGQGDALSAGTELQVNYRPGGSAVLTFKAEVDECDGAPAIVNRVNLDAGQSSATAIAVTACQPEDDD